jgi:hypothetical protein
MLGSFSPNKTRPESKSKHPKTTANHSRIKAMEGQELADHRANAAFRAAKCRQIKKLRRHPSWASWSDSKKMYMEAAIIQKLEEKRDQKKRENEIAFSVNWEKEYEKLEAELAKESASVVKGAAMAQALEEDIDPALRVEAAVKVSDKESSVEESLTPEDERGGDDDDGWITDEENVEISELWEKKEEGGRAFFARLGKLEKAAKRVHAEFLDKLATS